MKSRLILYKTDLDTAKNWIIEDIEEYLKECDFKIIGEVRWIEPKLVQTIVLKGNQNQLSGLGYNYARVSDDHSVYYYFVQSLEWASNKSIKCTLLLDTLNNLGSEFISDNITNKTSIIREHQDRWKLNGNELLAIVDKYDEGLSVAKDTNIKQEELVKDCYFYCQYSVNATTPNTTDTHPHKCMIAMNSSLQWSPAGTNSDTWNIPQDATSNIYSVLEGTVTAVTLDSGSKTYIIGQSTDTFDGITGVLRCVRVNNRRIQLLYFTNNQFPYAYLGYKQKDTSKNTSDNITVTNTRRLYYEPYDTSVWDTMFSLDRIPFQNYDLMEVGKYKAQVVNGIDDIDRTYSGLMQINPIPAFSITAGDSGYSFIEGYNMIVPKYYDRSLISSKAITTNTHTYKTPTYNDKYDYTLESKLLHNSITDAYLTYQGNTVFHFDFSRANNITYSVRYTLSKDNTQLLKFFTYPSGYDVPSPYDYYNFITNKYNVPLYSNNWTEYVRSGYNYDVAERNRQKTMQAWSIAANVVSGAVGLSVPSARGIGILASATKAYKQAKSRIIDEQFNNQFGPLSVYEYMGFEPAKKGYNMYYGEFFPEDNTLNKYSEYIPASKITPRASAAGLDVAKANLKNNNAGALGAMITSQAIGSIGSAISAGLSIDSANASYQQNINTRSQSRTSIQGNSTDYSTAIDNQLNYEVWQPQEYIKKNIAKTFYYTGYSHPVQELPDISSRLWFNYIQCVPVWKDQGTCDTNPLWLADYTQRLNQGVTIFHNVYKDGQATWDLNQTLENWEMNLYN